MPRGGRREGAGRKAGAAWRGPGPSPLRKMSRERVRALLESGHDPLQFLCAVTANKELDLAVRLHAAGLALPHLHPRLSAVAVADAGQQPALNPKDLIARLSEQLSRMAPAAVRPTIEAVAEADAETAKGDST